MDEKSYRGSQNKFEALMLDAAKEDLNGWKNINETEGQPEKGHPDYRPRRTCRYYGNSGDNYCQIDGLGKCIFYSCLDRQSYKEWRKHHKKAHPEDHLINKVRCDICKRLHDEETHFMEGCISEFEKKMNTIEMPKELLLTIESTVDADLDSIQAEEGWSEGKMGQRYVNFYERNPKLRSEAIRIHGLKCMTCKFDFEKRYGVLGWRFIEVHHLKPVSSRKKETLVNPETEMAVVCSNCHRMIHRKKDDVLSLEELRKIIRQNTGNDENKT